MISPFYIGQKVVCVKSHSQGVIKKGQEFTVTGVFEPDCNCDNWTITIGLKTIIPFHQCSFCGYIRKNESSESSEFRFGYTMFAPVQEDFKSISFTKVLEEELISVN